MRVLVVEDEPKMAGLLMRGLTEEGYAVDLAGTGADAVWAATENPYDAIVLDVMLPDLDGFAVCRRLRANDRWAPVLMLTARDALPDRVRGLDAGADDYLTKPFSFSELFARLRALLRRGAQERPSILRADDLELDPATHRVRRGDTPIELTAKEFALLEYLLRHAGEVLTRSQLIEHVWDFGYDGECRDLPGAPRECRGGQAAEQPADPPVDADRTAVRLPLLDEHHVSWCHPDRQRWRGVVFEQEVGVHEYRQHHHRRRDRPDRAVRPGLLRAR